MGDAARTDPSKEVVVEGRRKVNPSKQRPSILVDRKRASSTGRRPPVNVERKQWTFSVTHNFYIPTSPVERINIFA